jgi:choline-sulfatase
MKRRYILPSAAGALLLAMAALWLHDMSRPARLNVIFLTVESWRAETVTPQLMPHLLRAAETGTRFAAHRAIAAWTAPNIIAVLTGLSPFAQGVNARGQSLAPDRPVFLEDLSAAGWLVAGLQSFMTIDVFRNLGLQVVPGEPLLPWLALRARDRQPFALWYHYLGTHLPYAPAGQWRGAFDTLAPQLDAPAQARMKIVETAPAIPAGTVAFTAGDAPAIRALYQGGVAEFDAWFAGFWEFFNRSGLRQTTILVVTADHGEELLERGQVGHASTTRAGHLHEEVLQIPLFVWLPDAVRDGAAPGTVTAMTDHTDIVATLRRLLGVPDDTAGSGSLWDANNGNRRRMAATSFGGYAEPDLAHPSGFEVALRDGDWKLRLRQSAGAPIEPFLYRLSTDPAERDNLAAREPDRASAMARAIMPDLVGLWRPRHEPPAGTAEAALPTPEWVVPSSGGVVHFADIADGARLEWTGDPAGRYLVEYRAGNGPLAIDGQFEVTGTMKDFGKVGEGYWRTWVVPYGRLRLRVMPADAPGRSSEWIDLELRP